MRNFKFACLLVVLSTSAAIAQMTSPITSPRAERFVDSAPAAAAPVAYVYVSSNPANSSTNQIDGYAASADGRLTPIIGSPFADDVTSMAVNGRYLFASTRSGIYVAAFRMQADGALAWSRSTDIVRFNANDCGNSGPLFLDHTGGTLYDMEYQSDCANNSYQSLGVNRSTGGLQNLGSSGPDDWLYLPASFIGNNVYAYSAGCLSNMYWEIEGYKRSGNGLLSQINITAPLPAAKAGDFWCPSQTAADPANHVAMTLQPVNQNFAPDGPAQLATFTADSSGNLTTSGTVANMPQTLVGAVTDLKMAPFGKLLAVAGSAGLQVFHFNGGNPITADTGLLTTAQISQISWDKDNHLYAISQSAGKLYVFTVTPTTARQAAGSPYTLSGPLNIAVQPK